MVKILSCITIIVTCQFFVISLHAQVGKVGINTTTPAAMLHVKDSSVVFTGAIPPPGLPGAPPVSGTGSRMMWYPDKAALRAGTVFGNQWDKDSIGKYSIAFGNSTLAQGNASLAAGSSSKAYGDFSACFGTSSVAEGTASIASGQFSIAHGYCGVALGNHVVASGVNSTAFGLASIASGVDAFSVGSKTYAPADLGFAFGGHISIDNNHTTIARSYNSFVIGRYNDTTNMSSLTTWVDSDPLFVIGIGSAHASRKNAITILKNGNTGIGTLYPESLLHIKRNGSSNGIFHGNASIILESNQTDYIQFSQTNSTACGIIVGNQDISIRSSILFQPDSSIQFRAGGNSTKLSISKLGNIGIGTQAPEFPLHIVNATSGSGGFDNGIVIENNATSSTGEAAILFANHGVNGTGNNYWIAGLNETRNFSLAYGNTFTGTTTKMFLDSLGNLGVGTTSPSYLLEVNGTVGKPGGGSWANSSDKRLKKDIHPFADGLAFVLNINPVTFHYNELSGYDQKPEYVGVIAQELNEVAPYMVSVSDKQTADGTHDYLQVDNSAMTYMLINAVKEQQTMIESQHRIILELKEQMGIMKNEIVEMKAKAGE